jgi:hypothetical protein
MAKPLSPKSQLIRETITAHPRLGNTQLAELINGSDDRKTDKIQVTATDVSNQKQALKALNGKAKKKKASKAQKAASKGADRPQAAPARAAASPVDLVDRVFDLAERCGGFTQLKRLVDRIAEAKGK